MTVIFDFDGTLANTIDLALKIYNSHHEEYGALPVSRDEFPHLRTLGYKKAMKAKRIRWTMLPKLMLFISREMKSHMGEVKPYPGVVSVINELKKDGISVGVLTSNNAALVQEFFKDHDFPRFDFVVSEKTIFGKDKALKKIIKRHGIEKKDIIYVGDEPRDIHACRKAGVKVYGVSWGLGGEEGLAPNPPDKLAHSSKELLGFIRQEASEAQSSD